MANEPTDFRQRLFDAQEMNPAIHEAAIARSWIRSLNETHTPKWRHRRHHAAGDLRTGCCGWWRFAR